MNRLNTYFPLIEAVKNSDRASLKGDVGAGITTAVMLVPQAMAYAMLAGLEPIVGLYASTLPTAIYALMGTSRVLAVGPVAMVSLLVAGGVAPLAGSDPVLYTAYASILMLLVGLLQTGMGVAKLGFLVKYLSHSVIAGFSWAAALIIGFSQFKHLLGLPLERSHHVHTILLQAWEQSADIHWVTLGIAFLSIVTLVVLKKIVPRFPRFLLVVTVGTVAVASLNLDTSGVAVVGAVPEGLPALKLPTLTLAALSALFPTAIAIAMVGFMESIAVAKNFARQSGHIVEANQELRALGLANVGGAFLQGYPVTGGFSRTAVNAEAGARSGLAGMITALVVVISLLFLTPLFFYMPKAVLASIIMTAVLGLIDIPEAKHLWHTSRADFGILIITFFATLSLGIEQGILLGMASSLLWFISANSKPHVAVLGRLPGTTLYRNLDRNEDAIQTPGVIAIRMDAPLFFANTAFLSDTINDLVNARDELIHTVILDAGAIGSTDGSGAAALVDAAANLKAQNITLYLCTVRGPVRDALKALDIDSVLPSGNMVEQVEDAVVRSAGRRVAPRPGSLETA